MPNADQNRLVRELSEAATSGRGPFIGFLRHQLAFASSDRLEGDVDARFNEWGRDATSLVGETDWLVRAGLGVYLFCHHAEQWGHHRKETGKSRANALLSDQDVLELLYDVYELDDAYRDHGVELHEAGTTSFILRLRTQPFAVKIIKPWYLDDDVISRETRAYKETYGFLQSVIPDHFARIHASNRHCIVMDFIEGKTLREFFRSTAFKAIREPNVPASPHSLEAVLTGICSLLSQCASHSPPISHGDLSSTNILIEPSTGRLFLIDFGKNYLRSRPVGTAEQRSDVLSLRDVHEMENGINDDVDELGVILAEGLTGSDFAGEGLQAILDAVYAKNLPTGYFLDNLFHANARSGGASFPLEAATYDGLSNHLNVLFSDLARSEHARERRKLGLLDDLSCTLSPINVTQTASLIAGLLGGSSRSRRRGGPTPLHLRNLTWVPVLLNWFAIIMFVVVVASHRGDGVWPDIVGWACTLTYSIIAARYCVFVFSDLDLSDWPGRANVSVPVTCVLIWPPILFPLLIDWRWWPISVAIGTAIITVNNEICLRSSRTMKCVVEKTGGLISRQMGHAVGYLADWRELMGIFSGSIVVLSLLLWLDVLQDSLFYGVLVALAPAGKMYHQQTGSEAPIVRPGLHRLANAYRLSAADDSTRAACEQEANRSGFQRWWGEFRRQLAQVGQKWRHRRSRRSASPR